MECYSIGCFHVDIVEMRTAESKLHRYVGIDRTSTFEFGQPVDKVNRVRASTVLIALFMQAPKRVGRRLDG